MWKQQVNEVLGMDALGVETVPNEFAEQARFYQWPTQRTSATLTLSHEELGLAESSKMRGDRTGKLLH